MAKERSRQSPPRAGAWAIIYCAATDKFLFGKRSAVVSNSGAWNFFGGRIDRGEGPCSALRRELAEETGLRIKSKRLSKLSWIAKPGKGKRACGRELHYYLLTVDREVVPRLNHEHSGFGWFKRNSLPARFNRPTTLAIRRGLLKTIKL